MASFHAAAVLTMRIVLSQIGVQPKRIEEAFDSIDLAGEATMSGPAHFVGEIKRSGERVILSGRISSDVTVCCSRCLTETGIHIRSQFTDVLLDPQFEPLEAELELSEESLDESFALGGEVDLSELIRERILLELPFMPLCSVGCRGLCSKCGIDRNLNSCYCTERDVDPRWAVLKNLN
jgi:uncharacterized protein